MLINTTLGEMDDSLLKKVEGIVDNQNENIKWVEYYLNEDLVHRSVNMTIKEMPILYTKISSL